MVKSAAAAKESSPSRASAFDPHTHKPPQLDSFGFNADPMSVRNMMARHTKNVLSQPVDVPKWWSGKHVPLSAEVTMDESAKPVPRSKGMAMALDEKMTRTKLFERRKKEKLPDPSYDIDGDGFVGGRDYFIARHFDQGAKNYLTKEEREKLYKALTEVSNNFD